MIRASNWAREKGIPFLGICLGMQVAIIEFARSVCKLPDAHSEECKTDASDGVIIFMPEGSKTIKGATMRLGLRVTNFVPGTEGTKIRKLYRGVASVHERHRHRYEVNPSYVQMFEDAGMQFVGRDDAGVRMEICELKNHPYFVGTQYHPEYLSRVLYPSPPFIGLIAASAGILDAQLQRALTNGIVKGDVA